MLFPCGINAVGITKKVGIKLQLFDDHFPRMAMEYIEVKYCKVGCHLEEGFELIEANGKIILPHFPVLRMETSSNLS